MITINISRLWFLLLSLSVSAILSLSQSTSLLVSHHCLPESGFLFVAHKTIQIISTLEHYVNHLRTWSVVVHSLFGCYFLFFSFFFFFISHFILQYVECVFRETDDTRFAWLMCMVVVSVWRIKDNNNNNDGNGKKRIAKKKSNCLANETAKIKSYNCFRAARIMKMKQTRLVSGNKYKFFLSPAARVE